MKAPKYIYHVVDAEGYTARQDAPYANRENAREFKRIVEGYRDVFDDYVLPVKIIRFKVATTGEVIR